MVTLVRAAMLVSGVLLPSLLAAWQLSPTASYHTDVNLVSLTFSVIDGKGRPVNGLKAADVRIYEDGVPQKITGFAEGSTPADSAGAGGTSVFILFDTSNRMYESIPYVSDAIAEFLRRLDPSDSIAIYTFSKNLHRAAVLTSNRGNARAGLAQNVSIGSDTALFNCLLLTLRDAAKTAGRKAVVVFSNGPDNVSMVSPEDVGRVAEDEGIPVYMVSTIDQKDTLMLRTLERLTGRTGGRLYLARNWQAQARAFVSIREEIGSSYTAFYYPAPNPNEGFRQIRIEVLSPERKTFRVRARSGYQVKKPQNP